MKISSLILGSSGIINTALEFLSTVPTNFVAYLLTILTTFPSAKDPKLGSIKK